MVTKRCVRFRSTTFLHALTLLYLAEPLFFMHHAVSDRHIYKVVVLALR
jgi:hypothetical protein